MSLHTYDLTICDTKCLSHGRFRTGRPERTAEGRATDERAADTTDQENARSSMNDLDSLSPRHRTKVEEHSVFGRSDVDPVATVVVVTYQIDRPDFERTIDALEGQTDTRFELVVVDNGTGWETSAALEDVSLRTMYVRLDGNHGVTTARNIGARLASTDLLVFLDDDAVPEPDFVAQHCMVHRNRDIVAARGKVVPLEGAIYNRLETHYDIGEQSVPYFINTEGNSSIDRDVFLEVGGFDERLEGRAGHEGIELTRRLVESGVSREQIIYYPHAVIRHDFAESFSEYLRKKIRFKRLQCSEDVITQDHVSFVASYEDPGTETLSYRENVGLLFVQALVRVLTRWIDFVHRLRRA